MAGAEPQEMPGNMTTLGIIPCFGAAYNQIDNELPLDEALRCPQQDIDGAIAETQR